MYRHCLRTAGVVLLMVFVSLLVLPVLSVLGSWLPLPVSGLESAQAMPVLREMAATVLPRYIVTTLWLVFWVGLGTAVVGTVVAVVVTVFDFPGRRYVEWLLLLPLAMPAYVTAYAYTDFLQYSGPLQTAMRAATGLQGAMLPDIRSVGGAVWVFVFSLYPYVYLLARTALAERAAHLLEAARLLGAPLSRRLRTIALPLARPAVAAGVALVLMETMADYGVASYFGIQTFTTGIYKAWLGMDNRMAAAQLATLLLVVVVALLQIETHAQKKMRFTSGSVRSGSGESRPLVLRGGWRVSCAWLVCGVPVFMGFIAPVTFMLRPLAADWSVLPWMRFVEWTINSVRLAGITSVLAVLLALVLAFSVRRYAHPMTRWAANMAGLGYAVPGAVIVVGLLLPVGWLQNAFPNLGIGALVTATSLGIIWAYLVRFSAVALQTIQSGYARIPMNVDDSARMLGVGSFGVLSRVHWPLLKRSTAAAALLVWVDVMKELPATLVLRPFNSDTLAVVAYQLARDERLGEAALPSLALVAVGLVPVILLSRTLRSR